MHSRAKKSKGPDRPVTEASIRGALKGDEGSTVTHLGRKSATSSALKYGSPVEKRPLREESTSRKGTESYVKQQFDSLLERMTAENVSKTLQSDVRRLRRQTVATIRRHTGEKRRSNPNTGFNKKYPVSAECAEFMGWDPTEMHSRGEITQQLTKYIKEHGLQRTEPGRRREIVPDEELARLLQYDPKKDPPLQFTSMQTLVSRAGLIVKDS